MKSNRNIYGVIGLKKIDNKYVTEAEELPIQFNISLECNTYYKLIMNDIEFNKLPFSHYYIAIIPEGTFYYHTPYSETYAERIIITDKLVKHEFQILWYNIKSYLKHVFTKSLCRS